MAFVTSSDSSTEIIVISLFKSISSNSDRIANDDLSLLIASSFTDIEIIDTVSINPRIIRYNLYENTTKNLGHIISYGPLFSSNFGSVPIDSSIRIPW